MTTEETFAWIQEYLSAPVLPKASIELVSSFLIVWALFEQKLFDGYVQKCKIHGCAQKFAGVELDVEEMARHFHERYQVTEYKHNLLHGDNYEGFDTILGNEYDNLLNQDKLQLLIYVTYRYRNNIFHGSKGLMSWAQFSVQITYCINFMICLLDEEKGEAA